MAREKGGLPEALNYVFKGYLLPQSLSEVNQSALLVRIGLGLVNMNHSGSQIQIRTRSGDTAPWKVSVFITGFVKLEQCFELYS
jgi:hypothetical protein